MEGKTYFGTLFLGNQRGVQCKLKCTVRLDCGFVLGCQYESLFREEKNACY